MKTLRLCLCALLGMVWLAGCQGTSDDVLWPYHEDVLAPPPPPVSPEARLKQVQKVASVLHAGMSRAEVETLFVQWDGGTQSPTLTRYYEEPQVLVDVPYDSTGGN